MDQGRARELVSAERRRVEQLLDSLTEAEGVDRTASDVPQDFGDQGQQLTAAATDQMVADELRERLAALQRAEQRIADGTYGYSVRSGEPIPDERLEADPAAELTVEEARAEGR